MLSRPKLRCCVQMDGSDALLCSANTTLPVTGIANCPSGYACATLSDAFLNETIGGIADTFLNGALEIPGTSQSSSVTQQKLST